MMSNNSFACFIFKATWYGIEILNHDCGSPRKTHHFCNYGMGKFGLLFRNEIFYNSPMLAWKGVSDFWRVNILSENYHPKSTFSLLQKSISCLKNVARIYLYTNNTVAIKINQTADNQQKRRGKNREKGFIWLIFVTCSITHWQPYNLYTIKRLLSVSSE